MQQPEFTQSMNNFCQSMANPMMELTKLNIETFNRFTRNSDYLGSLMQAKKPEEVAAAQIKLLSTAGLETLKYMQNFSAIFIDAMNQGGKMFSEATKTAMNTQERAEKTAKSAMKGEK